MKTCEEWSLEFDLLYNNIASDKAPGLNEYEKSVFLTRAQEAIVVGLYKGTLGDAFESTEEMTAYLDTLVIQKSILPQSNSSLYKISSKSYLFKNPPELLFRTWESCKVNSTECGVQDLPVVPVTQDEYWRTVRNPFKKQNSQRVLRLSYAKNDSGEETFQKDGYTELISDYPVTHYIVRYLSRPKPIILQSLENTGLSIDGETDKMTCKLDEALHNTILAEAVRMAKAVWNN